MHLRGENLLTSTGDILNHGTAALGVVGGQHPGRRLVGMAPDAEFIAINRTETSVEEALLQSRDLGPDIFMYEYGSWVYEPLDGSSNMEMLIDDLYTEGFHQFTASGNLAGPTRKRHASLTLSPAGHDSLSLSVPSIGIRELYLSFLWSGKFPLSTRPQLSLSFPDGESVPINGDEVKRVSHNLTILSGYDYSPRGTARIDVLITSENSISGNFNFTIFNRQNFALSLHGYVADDISQWMNGACFSNHLTDNGTICSPGTALKGITVGAYDPRGTRNRQGDINDFSSWGATVDGRRGVEITAPGTLVYSLISSTGTSISPGGYFEFGGTSAALPHVAGCAALLLEAHPGLTPDELADALQRFTLQDTFTGPVPNDIWGYGKLRIHDVFTGLGLITSAPEVSAPSYFTVSEAMPNPFNSSVAFSITLSGFDSVSPLEITIFNILGQKVLTRSIPVHGSSFRYSWNGRSDLDESVSSGLYFARFSISNSIITRRMLLLR